MCFSSSFITLISCLIPISIQLIGMRVIKQKQSLPISNYNFENRSSTFKRHNALLGGGCKRGIFVGSSGCGKTNALLCLLLHPNGLRFENVYVYAKSLYQPKYKYLKEILKPINGLGYYEYDNGNEVIPTKDVKQNSVFVFDDVICDNQSTMRDYFSFGRHKNLDCFYLAQTYSKIPKQLIRDNANFLVIFEQDNTNLKHIYNDHIGNDMSFQQFKDVCSLCWKQKYGFLVIDKECDRDDGRYRKGFDNFLVI